MSIPMMVVSGYLGAGKTTLINHVLRNSSGKKIMVLVNDFGAINIDADLLESSEEDTITLTNGCVCCTMGNDLFVALGNAIDRVPPAELIIVEASGVAQPENISEAAKAEPELEDAGIVTVVDSLNFEGASADPLIGQQVRDQVAAAGILLVSKAEDRLGDLEASLEMLSQSPIRYHNEIESVDDLLDGMTASGRGKTGAHAPNVSWSYAGEKALPGGELEEIIGSAPAGIYRIKGNIRDLNGEMWEVHRVGSELDVKRSLLGGQTKIAAIGPKGRFDPAEVQAWWDSR